MARFILACIGMMMLVQQAHAVEWRGAPVACLPDRAQRWGGSFGDMQPCHCPPQDYCPEPLVNILKPKDIELHISLNNENGNMSIVINGESLGETVQEVFSVPTETIIRRYGCYEGCNGSTTWILKYVPEVLDDWSKDTLKLPVRLASRCCDNLCPSGMTPTFESRTIEKPREPDEGVQMSREDMDGLRTALNSLRSDLQAAGGLNAQVTATLDLSAALKNYLDSGLMDVDSLRALLNKLTSFNDLIKRPAVPASIKNRHAETTGKAAALAQQVAQEISLLTSPSRTIQVTAFSCSSTNTFELPREGCLIAGTQITLADGSKKAIEDLTLDDKVKGNHGPAKIIALNKFTQRDEQMYSVNGGQAFFTIEHPVLTPGGWKSVDAKVTSIRSDAKMIGSLQVGDIILMEGGEQLKVESIEKVDIRDGSSAYNLSVEGDGSFIANGFIMKGFKKLQLHY